jgi:hypothetical protein
MLTTRHNSSQQWARAPQVLLLLSTLPDAAPAWLFWCQWQSGTAPQVLLLCATLLLCYTTRETCLQHLLLWLLLLG